MMMSAEEASRIRSEYLDCPFYVAIEQLAKSFSTVDNAPAGDSSLLFYLAVNAIDDIKCAGNTKRRMERCSTLKADLIYYLKANSYEKPRWLAAEIITCVKEVLIICSSLEYVKEVCVLYRYIHELIGDSEQNDILQEYATHWFRNEVLASWLKDYFKSRNMFISDDLAEKIRERRLYGTGTAHADGYPPITEANTVFFKEHMWFGTGIDKKKITMPVEDILHAIYDNTKEWNPDRKESVHKWLLMYKVLLHLRYFNEEGRVRYSAFVKSVVRYCFPGVKKTYGNNISKSRIDKNFIDWQQSDKDMFSKLKQLLDFEELTSY